jgi:hypothetical protein
MSGKNQENLRDLFERFVDSEQAERAVEDIKRGEEILHQWPAPKPSGELLAQIKSQIGRRLVHRGRRHVRWFASRAAAIAAAFVIIGSVWTGLHRDGGPGVARAASLIPAALWESNNIAADDLRLATLTAEVERIENEMKSLLLGEGASDESAIDDAEIELMNIQGEFWKG